MDLAHKLDLSDHTTGLVQEEGARPTTSNSHECDNGHHGAKFFSCGPHHGLQACSELVALLSLQVELGHARIFMVIHRSMTVPWHC